MTEIKTETVTLKQRVSHFWEHNVLNFWAGDKELIVMTTVIVISTVTLNAIVTKRILNRTRVQVDWKLY